MKWKFYSFLLLVAFTLSCQSATKTYTYNLRNQLTSIVTDDDPSNPITFTYDEAGNRKTKTHNGVLTEYEWSPRGNLAEVIRNGNWLARYQYDFLNRRISKEIREIGKNSVKTLYVYDGYENHLLAETNVLGNTIVKYHWANGRAIGETRNGQNYFYFHDAMGSIVAVTAQDGSVVARIQYDAFGNVTATSGSHTGLFGFTGYYADDETGLLYAHNRYYDSELGAFISEDSFEGSLEDPPTLHGFLYAKANPTKYIDPDGRCNMGYMDYTSLLSCEDHYKEISELTAEQRLADQKLINDVQLGAIKGVGQAAGDIVVGAAQTAKDIGGAYVEAATGGRVAKGSMLRLRSQVDATIDFVQNPVQTVKTAVRNHNLIVSEMEARGDFEGAAQERTRFATTGLLATAGGGASGALAKQRLTRSQPDQFIDFDAPPLPNNNHIATIVTESADGPGVNINNTKPFNRKEVTKGFQDHHIVSDKNKATKDHPLLELAGYGLQKRSNKIFLPTSGDLHPTRSIHKGRHLNSVSVNLATQMDQVVEFGMKEKWTQQQFKNALDTIIAKERHLLRTGQRALNKNKREDAQ